MNLQAIKQRLKSQSIFFSEDPIGGRPAVIGYEKKFRWQWFATQLKTFVVAIDFGDEPVDEAALSESFPLLPGIDRQASNHFLTGV